MNQAFPRAPVRAYQGTVTERLEDTITYSSIWVGSSRTTLGVEKERVIPGNKDAAIVFELLGMGIPCEVDPSCSNEQNDDNN
jgi:hypothetical protein